MPHNYQTSFTSKGNLEIPSVQKTPHRKNDFTHCCNVSIVNFEQITTMQLKVNTDFRIPNKSQFQKIVNYLPLILLYRKIVIVLDFSIGIRSTSVFWN